MTMPGSSLIREHSASDEEFVEKVSTNPPVVLHDVLFGPAAIRGEIIGVPLLPDAVVTPDGQRAVIEAVRVGVQRGALFVGLGALTAPATASGRAVVSHVPASVTVTNGNGLTAAVVRQNVEEVRGDRPPGETRVTVVGATGSVGVPLSHVLSEDGFDLVLVGSSLRRATRVLGDLADRAVLAGDLRPVAEADIVVVLTNDRAAKLVPEHLRPGAVVIDVAQPPNVEDGDQAAFERRGVSVARGGVVRIPGYSCKQDFRLPDCGQTFACLAETYALAREGVRETSVGRPSPDYVRRMAELASRHGIVACPLGVTLQDADPGVATDALSLYA
jgi:fatty aldehyde-generating acyl-ACP reductase